jgi:hypothetical protein
MILFSPPTLTHTNKHLCPHPSPLLPTYTLPYSQTCIGVLVQSRSFSPSSSLRPAPELSRSPIPTDLLSGAEACRVGPLSLPLPPPPSALRPTKRCLLAQPCAQPLSLCFHPHPYPLPPPPPHVQGRVAVLIRFRHAGALLDRRLQALYVVLLARLHLQAGGAAEGLFSLLPSPHLPAGGAAEALFPRTHACT